MKDLVLRRCGVCGRCPGVTECWHVGVVSGYLAAQYRWLQYMTTWPNPWLLLGTVGEPGVEIISNPNQIGGQHHG